MRILIANALATFAHRGQIRKVTGEPYVNHPRRVAARARTLRMGPHAEAAALLHDVLEDTAVPAGVIRLLLGKKVLGLVLELTDVYTPEAFPDRNRAWRKRAEAMRLYDASYTAKLLKLLDIEDNLDSFVSPAGIREFGSFVHTFGEEAKFLAAVLKDEHTPVSRSLAGKIHVQAQRGIELAARAREKKKCSQATNRSQEESGVESDAR